MLKKTSLLILLGLLLVAAVGYGVARLFILRYEDGDVYPPYSSLRADPLGVKGVYEALGQLPGVAVRRNFKPLPKLKPVAPLTLVYAGVTHDAMWEQREIAEFDRIVFNGSRAIFAFRPFERSPHAEEIQREAKAERARRHKERAEEKRKRGQGPASEEKKADAERSDEEGGLANSPLIEFAEVARRWGLAFDFLPASEEKKFGRRAILQAGERALEPEISWHSALYFKDLKADWTVLYVCENQPVVIERKYGRGTIVLAADAFFLSNEAMRAARLPQFLAWLFDGPAEFVFDEEHHGLRDDPGIASLARKYRLHGVVAGLVLLAALFVWKNAARFLPPIAATADAEDVVTGKESSEGFVHLLRRTIPPAQILGVCATEWRKTFAHSPRGVAKVEELCAQEQARPSRERDPVNAYRAIVRALPRH